MSITVRRAGPEDAVALRDLHAMPNAQAGTLQLPFPSLQQGEQKLTPRDGIYSLLAECEGQVAGALVLMVEPMKKKLDLFLSDFLIVPLKSQK